VQKFSKIASSLKNNNAGVIAKDVTRAVPPARTYANLSVQRKSQVPEEKLRVDASFEEAASWRSSTDQQQFSIYTIGCYWRVIIEPTNQIRTCPHDTTVAGSQYVRLCPADSEPVARGRGDCGLVDLIGKLPRPGTASRQSGVPRTDVRDARFFRERRERRRGATFGGDRSGWFDSCRRRRVPARQEIQLICFASSARWTGIRRGAA
jgi:hypothetical protein